MIIVPKEFISISMARKVRRSALARFFYHLRYRIGEYAVRGTVAALPYVPRSFMDLLTRFLARVTFMLLWKYRVRMQQNLELALGEEFPSAAERRQLAWRAWENFGQGVLDTMDVLHDSPEKLASKIVLEGEEHIKRALEKGKGVLALSAHLGAFTLIGPRLAAAGYPFSVVVKQPADERFARALDELRAKVGVHTISAKPRRDAVRNILKALRQNHIVLVIADEFRSGEVIVDFLGLKVPAPRGPAALALRTGAETLPVFSVRKGRGRVAVSVGAPVAAVQCEDIEKSVAATTARYTEYLEAEIRRHPEQWNWLGLPRHSEKISRASVPRIAPQVQSTAADKVELQERQAGTS